jgi:hypothetical protein
VTWLLITYLPIAFGISGVITMKRLLLIGLTTILSLSSLATGASADQDWYRNRESYHQAETSNLSPIPEPLRYRVERRQEAVEPEISKDHKWQRADRDEYREEYRRERRHQNRMHRYYHGTRNDPGRY